MENCDENLFPVDVLQRLDFISNLDSRIKVLHELENYYRSNPISDQIRDSLVDKILFHLTKFTPPNYEPNDIELITTYLRLLVYLNRMTMEVVAEFIYWYLEGGDRLR